MESCDHAELVERFSQKEVARDLRPFLPLNQRDQVGNIYEVAKVLVTEACFSDVS